MNKSDKASALQGRRGLGTNKSYGGNGYMKNIILPRNKCQEERKKKQNESKVTERGAGFILGVREGIILM